MEFCYKGYIFFADKKNGIITVLKNGEIKDMFKSDLRSYGELQGDSICWFYNNNFEVEGFGCLKGLSF